MPLSEEVLRTWRIVILLRKSWSEPTQFILHSPYFLIQSIVLPILRLLVYVRCYKIDNRNDHIKETRQEYPKQSLYPTIRQPHTFIPWHHIIHIIEMASEDILIRLSVVFKKIRLVFNEFLPVVDCLFYIGIINLSFDNYELTQENL